MSKRLTPCEDRLTRSYGRLEDGRAHQHLQLLEGHTVGFGGLKTGHQVLDFLLLGEADSGRELAGWGWGFFLRRHSTGGAVLDALDLEVLLNEGLRSER